MTNRRYILLLLLLSGLVLHGRSEVVKLQSGQTITGEIILQNDDVVMVRDSEGHKFQFPRAQVVEIMSPAVPVEQTVVSAPTKSEKGNCALRLCISGGALWVPSFSHGGQGSVDVQIGSRRIGNQRIFLGGSVGYQIAMANQAYHFLPLMLAVSMPLLDGKYAPEIGAALGYGFAIKQPSQGGLVTKLDVSWRYQYGPSSALILGVQARFQQTMVQYTETIESRDYQSVLGRNFVSLGVQLALEF